MATMKVTREGKADQFTDEYGDKWLVAAFDGNRCWAVNRADGSEAGEVAWFARGRDYELYTREEGATFDGETCRDQYVVRGTRWEENE